MRPVCRGEFIIIKCENETVWELLTSKGHVVSRNGKYACIYLPYHYMGLETPISILLGDILGLGTHSECRQVSVMAGVAQKDMPKGTILKVQGHHHPLRDWFRNCGNSRMLEMWLRSIC